MQVLGKYFCFAVDVQTNGNAVAPAIVAGGVSVIVLVAISAPTVPAAPIVTVMTPVPAVVAAEPYLPVTGAPTPAVISSAAGYVPLV